MEKEKETKKMKKIAILVLALVLVFGTAYAEIYPMALYVVEVNHEEDVVVLGDGNGEEWIWEGAEDWMVGDVAGAIVEDNNTRCIYDDELVTLRYCGYIRECMHNQFGTTGW